MSKQQVTLFSILSAVSIVLMQYFFPYIDTTENSLLEDMQAVVIALGMLLYGYRSLCREERDMRIINIGITLLLFSFLIRELDVEEFVVLPEFIRYYLGKEGKDTMMLFLWGGYLLMLLFGIREVRYQVKKFFFAGEGKWWIIACVLLVLSQLMDKNVLHLHHHHNRYYEEFWELFSYGYMFLASWIGIYQRNQSTGI